MSIKQLLLLPDVSYDNGGPTTFFLFLKGHLSNNNIKVCHNFDHKTSHCLVINGTRKIHLLIFLWLSRKPISVRLGSIYRSNMYELPGIIGSIRFFPRFLAMMPN